MQVFRIPMGLRNFANSGEAYSFDGAALLPGTLDHSYQRLDLFPRRLEFWGSYLDDRPRPWPLSAGMHRGDYLPSSALLHSAPAQLLRASNLVWRSLSSVEGAVS